MLPLPACGGDDEPGGVVEVVEGAPDVSQTETPEIAGPKCKPGVVTPECPTPTLCAPCGSDADCGSGTCRQDARGAKFCTRKCGYFAESACDENYYCKQVGNSAEEFFCHPVAGVCVTDGLDCSPCDPKDPASCAEGLTCHEPLGGLGFCTRPCPGGTCDNPKFGCQHDGADSLCFPLVNLQPKPKCGALPLGFCEPCRTDGACETGFCWDNENVGQFCSKHCESDDECPINTDCVQGGCQPPIAHGCQGFLACFGAEECPKGQQCFHGFCIDPP